MAPCSRPGYSRSAGAPRMIPSQGTRVDRPDVALLAEVRGVDPEGVRPTAVWVWAAGADWARAVRQPAAAAAVARPAAPARAPAATTPAAAARAAVATTPAAAARAVAAWARAAPQPAAAAAQA